MLLSSSSSTLDIHHEVIGFEIPSWPPCHGAPTRSPIFHSFSPGPTATTLPIVSCPGIIGLSSYTQRPLLILRVRLELGGYVQRIPQNSCLNHCIRMAYTCRKHLDQNLAFHWLLELDILECQWLICLFEYRRSVCLGQVWSHAGGNLWFNRKWKNVTQEFE